MKDDNIRTLSRTFLDKILSTGIVFFVSLVNKNMTMTKLMRTLHSRETFKFLHKASIGTMNQRDQIASNGKYSSTHTLLNIIGLIR